MIFSFPDARGIIGIFVVEWLRRRVLPMGILGIKGSRDRGIKGSGDQGIGGSRDRGIKGSRLGVS